jgi:hypothetical protein
MNLSSTNTFCSVWIDHVFFPVRDDIIYAPMNSARYPFLPRIYHGGSRAPHHFFQFERLVNNSYKFKKNHSTYTRASPNNLAHVLPSKKGNLHYCTHASPDLTSFRFGRCKDGTILLISMDTTPAMHIDVTLPSARTTWPHPENSSLAAPGVIPSSESAVVNKCKRGDFI